MNNKVITQSFEETQKLGEKFSKKLNDYRILALYGKLGNGKTTFVQGLAKGLGISGRIISPTFIIVRNYNLPNQKDFYHVDLYRVGGQKDVEGLGLSEILNDEKNIVAIEWAEKIQNLLPEKRIDINFEYIDESKRKITFKHG